MDSGNLNLTPEMMASFIASIVISVIRDRSLSSSYGLYLSHIKNETGDLAAPPLEDFFSNKMAERLELDLRKRLGENGAKVVLYADLGDLFGQLSRLLIACNEILEDQTEIIDRANARIDSLNFSRQVNNTSHIRHLRNAVLHGHFFIAVDESNPFGTILRFQDANPNSNRITADYSFTAEDLNAVIDILVDVCLRYLEAIGWEIA